jgi:cytochrome d ubiquinol oxidase subunit I
MVAVGSTISAFWILVANSWQQTPAGYVIQNGRAELVDFWAAVFNPSTLPRFFHTFVASLISGSFLMTGVAAYWLIRNKFTDVAKKTINFSIVFGLIVSLLELFPFGHEHAKQVARTQPEKFAAIQGLYKTQEGAPLAIFAVPGTKPPKLHFPIEIPGLLSWLAFGDINAEIKGINEFPPDEIPPLWLTFVSYHNMVVLGLYFIFITALATYYLYKKKLFDKKGLLKVLLWSTPLPLIACQLGWIAAEVGRQPWVVYKLMRTSDAVSITVGTGELLFSIIMFLLIYIFLGLVFLRLLFRWVKNVPTQTTGEVAK